jgi:hypothetical protein
MAYLVAVEALKAAAGRNVRRPLFIDRFNCFWLRESEAENECGGTAVRASLFCSVLDLRHAPIDGEIYTGDVRTFIGGEEHDCRRDFLGHASATHWDLRGELCDRLLDLFSGKARRRR